MSAITIHDLPDEILRGLTVRAATHGRSTEAEILAILEEVVLPPERIKLGSALREFAQRFGGLDLDITRDPAPIQPVVFE